MELFCDFLFFLQNSSKKKTFVLESLFNKVTGLYPATSLKERCLRQSTSRRLLLFYGKRFYQQNRKELSEKRKKKLKQFVRKTTTRTEQKLNRNLDQVFISFYYSKIYLLLFSMLLMIY